MGGVIQMGELFDYRSISGIEGHGYVFGAQLGFYDRNQRSVRGPDRMVVGQIILLTILIFARQAGLLEEKTES